MAAGTAIYNNIYALIPSTTSTDLFGTAVLAIAIDGGLLWHSQFKPQRVLQMGTGTGTTAYFDLPDDFIHMRLVEYPYGGTPPTYVSATDWHVHQGTAVDELVFETSPDNGETLGIHYDGTWTLAEVPATGEMPLAYLSCAFLCIREATRLASNISPLIDADVVDYRDHSRSWLRLSEEFMGMYASAYGLSAKTIKSGAPPPAFAIGKVSLHQRYDHFWWKT